MKATKGLTLRLKWGVSRGVDTYGYNILSAFDVQTNKRLGSCNGGGYDMHNSVLCFALCDVYQNELDQACSDYIGDESLTKSGFYRSPKGRVSFDGACGRTATEKVCELLGLELSSVQATRSVHIVKFTPIAQGGV